MSGPFLASRKGYGNSVLFKMAINFCPLTAGGWKCIFFRYIFTWFSMRANGNCNLLLHLFLSSRKCHNVLEERNFHTQENSLEMSSETFERYWFGTRHGKESIIISSTQCIHITQTTAGQLRQPPILPSFFSIDCHSISSQPVFSF